MYKSCNTCTHNSNIEHNKRFGLLEPAADVPPNTLKQKKELLPGLPHVREKSGKSVFFQGQGNVREF